MTLHRMILSKLNGISAWNKQLAKNSYVFCYCIHSLSEINSYINKHEQNFLSPPRRKTPSCCNHPTLDWVFFLLWNLVGADASYKARSIWWIKDGKLSFPFFVVNSWKSSGKVLIESIFTGLSDGYCDHPQIIGWENGYYKPEKAHVKQEGFKISF